MNSASTLPLRQSYDQLSAQGSFRAGTSVSQAPTTQGSNDLRLIPMRKTHSVFQTVSSDIESPGNNLKVSGISLPKNSNDEWILSGPKIHRLQEEVKGRDILLQKFEGVVLDIATESFYVRFRNNEGQNPTFDAEFSKDEISENDARLLATGGAVVWTIVYKFVGDTRKRESELYFRRLPKWDAIETADALKWANELQNGIKWT
jgi:hypothetical protein